ncbi:hypothetical protein I1A49_46105 [Streptomyces malaysiensis subsp. malaysiensis]|uniref:Uncharacterized protein n=1 Tax=Streptomyces malaysiensis TaxID=92644 RepID=A0ABX6WLL6_STRMQ|nr:MULTISPECIES: hypothetical protein [Streptomyces]QPI62355.1 hypothetical protein I1A49_46105 [Streptomyces solisilvae]UHH23081.1 hypothetical protein LUV23_46265 [Streptomyces sp. HNM0561]
MIVILPQISDRARELSQSLTTDGGTTAPPDGIVRDTALLHVELDSRAGA